MTEPTTPTDTAPSPPPPEAVADPVENTTTEPSEADNPDRQRAAREAAKYRTQLRETEAERDTLRAEVDTYRSREVVRLAKDSGLIEPEDLLKQVPLADMVVDGAIDPQLVQTAITGLRESRPQWFDDYAEHARPPSNRPIETLRPGATPRDFVPETKTWGSVLSDAAKKRG
jgi:hypothetical protein